MNNKNKIFEFFFREKKLIFEIDSLTTKFDKSIICHYGNNIVLTNLNVKKNSNNNNFYPLIIHCEERFYAINKIPNSFTKREAKPSDEAIILSRLIDRSLRSFFPNNGNQEIQINNYFLSVEKNDEIKMISLWNSFLVCFISKELNFFKEPLGTVIIKKNNEFFISKNNKEKELISLEMIISSTEEKIIMLDIKADEINEKKLEEEIELAWKEILFLINLFKIIKQKLNIKKEKIFFEKIDNNHISLKKEINMVLSKLFLEKNNFAWLEKEKLLQKNKDEMVEKYENIEKNDIFDKNLIEKEWKNCLKIFIKNFVEKKGFRLDNRKIDEIRPIKIKINYIPNAHGSALVCRGETKVLSVLTLGKTNDRKMINNTFSYPYYKNFFHHYNFHTSENSRYRGVSRRELGHGELVEKSFYYLIPEISKYFDSARIVSEVLSSDGSSSQTSIIASCKAFESANIFIKKIAGLSMGKIGEKIYTDINALEDEFGEFDFKIAGTKKGICSSQLDVKNEGVDRNTLKECLEKSRKARLKILENM